METRLAKPTRDLVQKYILKIQRDPQFSSQDKALSNLLAAFPLNQHLEDVILKASTINSLYHTNIFDIHKVAQHIVELQIDPQLESGSPELIDEIAYVTLNGKKKRFYSFATKYCSFHRPEIYPIFDGTAEWLINSYQKSDHFGAFSPSDLHDYPHYKEIIKSFRAHYGLTEFTFRQLDNFLWAYGQEMKPKQKPQKAD